MRMKYENNIDAAFDAYYRTQERAQEEAGDIVRHYLSSEVGVLIPLRQAIALGVSFSALTTFGALKLNLSADLFDAAGWGGLVGALVITFWLIYSARDWRAARARIEEILRVDLNNDGYVGEPEPEAERDQEWVLITKDDEGRQFIREVVQGRDKKEELAKFAYAVLNGAELSELKWDEAKWGLSITQLRDIKIFCKGMHYLRQAGQSKNAPFVVTRAGWSAFQSILAEYAEVDRGVIEDKYPTPPGL